MLRKSASLKEEGSKEENSTQKLHATRSENLDSEFLKTLLGRLYKRKYDLKSTGTTLVLFGSQPETSNTEPCRQIRQRRRKPTLNSKRPRPDTSSVYRPSISNDTYTMKYNIKYTSTRLIVLNNKCQKQGASRILKSWDTNEPTDRHSTVNPKRHLPWIRPSSYNDRHSLCRSDAQTMVKSTTTPQTGRRTARPRSWNIGTFLHEVRSSVNPHRHRHCLPESDTQSQTTSPRPMEFWTSTPVPGRTRYHSPYTPSLSRSQNKELIH